MKKILLSVLIVSACALGIIFWRTVRFQSPLADITPSDTPLEWKIDAEAAVSKLREALTYPTISHRRDMMDLDAFQGFLNFLGRSFPKVFSELKVDTVNDFTLLFTWEGSNPRLDPIVLMGHYDVVPVEATTLDRWDALPFSGDTLDGYVYGRGAIDNKTPCIAILETVENLLAYGIRPRRTLLISLGHDEEIGGDDGAVQVVKLLEKRNIRPALVLDEGGTLGQGIVPGVDNITALIGTAEKGYLSVELLVKGAGGHSSMPERNNTLALLTEAMQRINEHPMPFEISDPVRGFIECMGPYMQFPANMAFANTWLFKPLIFKTFSKSAQGAAMLRTTQVPTMVSGGVKDNVVPNFARAVYNFRLLPGHTDSMIINRLRTIAGDSTILIRPLQDAPYTPGSKASPYDDQVFRQLAGVVKTTFPQAIVSPYLVLGATDARHFTGISTHVYRFNPILLRSEDLPRIHGINERVGMSDYLTAIQFYAQFIQHFCIDDGLSKKQVRGKI